MATKKPEPRPGRRKIDGKSLSKQAPAKEADINNIVRRYLPTGALPSHGRQGMYGDFTSIDYMSMLNAVADIDNTFRRLPARVRGQFRNDPYQLMRFVENPDNQKEAVRLGLLRDPSKAFGYDGESLDGPQLEDDQTDMMSQAEIMDALDPDSRSHDPQVAIDLQAAAKGGDAEAVALLEAHNARQAARKAQRAEGKRTPGPLPRKPQRPPEGGR